MRNLNITSKNKATSREADAKKIAELQAMIAHAKTVRDWQVAEGYATLADRTTDEITKLSAKLAKLV